MTTVRQIEAATSVAVQVVRGYLDDPRTGAWRALDGVDDRADLVDVALGCCFVIDQAVRDDTDRVLRLLDQMPSTPAVLVAAHHLRGHAVLTRRRLERTPDPAGVIVELAALLVDTIVGRHRGDDLRPLLSSIEAYLIERAGGPVTAA